ncbi:MAG: hypothetical protein R3B84_10100 [Zavarzinella sp.]
MSSLIENYLYGPYGTHALLELSISVKKVMVSVAPWSDTKAVTVAVFEAAQLQHVCGVTDTQPEEASLPWDIIGFDCTDLGGGRWEFLLFAGGIQFCWQSVWPVSTAQLTPQEQLQLKTNVTTTCPLR